MVLRRINLIVPFGENEAARSSGARWDRKRKTWYVPNGADPSLFGRWRPPCINIRSSSYYLAWIPQMCWKCNRPNEVSTFILPKGYEALFPDEDDPENGCADDCWERMTDPCALSYVEYLMPTVQARMTSLNPNYRRNFSKQTNLWYWMNHCQGCGTPQDDHFLHSEPEDGFLPIHFKAARDIRVHRVDRPLQATASFREAESFSWLWQR